MNSAAVLTPQKTTPKRGRPVKKTSTLLINAKRVLEEGRWVRGCLKKGGAHCALGAVCAATGAEWGKTKWGDKDFLLSPQQRHSVSDACEFLNRSVQEDPSALGSIVFFNDEVARSKKQVLARFDAAIAAAKRAERRSKPELVNA